MADGGQSQVERGSSFTVGVHRLGDAYRSVVSAIKPTSNVSKFIENGTLTAEEFLEAGDQLAFKFPTWQWVAGDPAKRASYLPAEKQYLVTRNVPCRDRVRALDYVLTHKTRSEDEWLLPETNAADQGGALQDVDDLARGAGPAADPADGPGADDEEEGGSGGFGGICVQDDFIGGAGGGLPDFGDLDDRLAEEDPAAAPAYVVAEAPDAHLASRTRTYDLSITYDKYYQTPRLWLFGYDEGGEPLRPELVFEDVLSEYVDKTVTVDPHPLTGTPTVSIHPCKHALVMKKVINDWIEQGIEPRHDLALFVFLKFISGVVPTINYDFTMDIEF